ncbi:hypothetical protein BCR35DRAFT_355571 [Leucosporidium creatinivorum]|uniref:Protection of telomeres protein 1 n=1 Tax=Leucosporidium creatinivorum TaxID=106004 RepID=A0A1Y2DC26_9BASI|nr:hypothetical protein BCR35DRAFT_355571 [Leucosporidium creatinivorum]
MQRGQSSKSKPKAPAQPVELLLGDVSSPPSPFTFYRGIVVSHRPYHIQSRVASIVLGPLPSAAQGAKKMEVRLKGTWAEDAMKRFEVGMKVGIVSERGKKQEVKRPKGVQAEPGKQWREFGLIYEQGIKGWVFNSEEDDVEEFEFVAHASSINTSAAAVQARTELPDSSPQQQLNTTNDPPATRPIPSTTAQPIASTSRSTSPSAAPTKQPSPAPAPTPPSTIKPTKSTSNAPANPRADKSSNSTSAEKEVLATSQEKVPESEGGKGKEREDGKRKASHEGEGSRSQRKKKKLERKWELEVTKKDDPIFGKNVTIVYTPLSKHERAKNGKGISVIAVASVLQPVKRAERGTKDWSISLRLIDPTRLDDFDRVNLFATAESELPKVEEGDVIVLQNLHWKGSTYQEFVGYKDKARFLVFPRSKLLASPPIPDTALLNTPLHLNRVASCGPLEVAYARDMALFMEGEATPLAAAGAGGGREEAKKLTAAEKSAALRRGGGTKRPMLEIKDMEADNFCDTVVEVIKIWTGGQIINRLGSSDSIAVYVTDYTRHPEVYVSNSNAEPQFADGLALQVSVFGSQAQVFHGLKERGPLLFIRNLRPKLNPHGLLEGNVSEDPKFGDKRDVMVLKSGSEYKKETEALLKRRKAWWDSKGGDEPINEIVAQPRILNDKPNPLPSIICDRVSDPIGNMSGALAARLPGIYHFEGRVIDYHPKDFEDWVNAYCSECRERLKVMYDSCQAHPTAP